VKNVWSRAGMCLKKQTLTCVLNVLYVFPSRLPGAVRPGQSAAIMAGPRDVH